MPPDNICIQCKNGFPRGYFQITKIKADGSEEGSVCVCSIICLIQYAYAYAGRLGQRGLAGVENVIKKIAGAFQQLKGP